MNLKLWEKYIKILERILGEREHKSNKGGIKSLRQQVPINFPKEVSDIDFIREMKN